MTNPTNKNTVNQRGLPSTISIVNETPHVVVLAEDKTRRENMGTDVKKMKGADREVIQSLLLMHVQVVAQRLPWVFRSS
jgi:hypothetical protein